MHYYGTHLADVLFKSSTIALNVEQLSSFYYPHNSEVRMYGVQYILRAGTHFQFNARTIKSHFLLKFYPRTHKHTQFKRFSSFLSGMKKNFQLKQPNGFKLFNRS